MAIQEEQLCPDTAEAYKRMADKQPYDYAHMKRTLDSLMVAWKMNPYLRLGQLLENAKAKNFPSSLDLFYVEDDRLAAEVMKFSEENVIYKAGYNAT